MCFQNLNKSLYHFLSLLSFRFVYENERLKGAKSLLLPTLFALLRTK
jgi:hypothetical protein